MFYENNFEANKSKPAENLIKEALITKNISILNYLFTLYFNLNNRELDNVGTLNNIDYLYFYQRMLYVIKIQILKKITFFNLIMIFVT